MELEVLDKTGKSTGRKVKLSDNVFGFEPNNHAVYLDVKHYLANQRQGTHKAKVKGEISASTRKIKKQKGTGTARAGSLKSPVFRGGGRIFGPEPRDYGFKLNKKTKLVARKSALATQLNDKKLVVVEDLTFDAPKTKEFASVLKAIDAEGKRVTFVTKDNNKNLYLSSRNLQRFKMLSANDVNTYDLLNCKLLVLSESSINEIENRLS